MEILKHLKHARNTTYYRVVDQFSFACCVFFKPQLICLVCQTFLILRSKIELAYYILVLFLSFHLRSIQMDILLFWGRMRFPEEQLGKLSGDSIEYWRGCQNAKSYFIAK